MRFITSLIPHDAVLILPPLQHPGGDEVILAEAGEYTYLLVPTRLLT